MSVAPLTPARAIPFESACELIESILAGEARRSIADEVSRAGTLGAALVRLRDSMRSHAWKVGAEQIALGRVVKEYDSLTRVEGFHVLHDWDGKADRVNEDTIPVEVLEYVMDQRGDDAADSHVAAILVDYYFVNLLALLSLRLWDAGDADANLDRLNRLLAQLQGSGGSGQPFAADAETLMLIATSHFEVVEIGYERLLDRVRALDRAHRVNVALGHAASMGSHLRFGFEATYARDTIVMRDDNVADYPWLCFALAELMEEYERIEVEAAASGSRERLVESLFSGLSADPRAFLGHPPSSLSAAERDRTRFVEGFHRHRDDLLTRFEPLRPTDRAYSPLSFFFNFSHNVLKGTVVDALLRGRPWELTFNDLLTGIGEHAATKHELATTLMGYARRNPDRIRGRLMPVIVYDPSTGREAFSAAMRKLRS
jgi:hypothetical protein